MATQRNNEKEPLRVGGACCAVALSLVLAGQWPAEAVAYATEGGAAAASGTVAGAQAGLDDAQTTDAAIDVSSRWTHEGLTLSAAGRYVLSADVKEAGALSLAVPKGETVELDVAGHTVEFADDVTCGIDLSACEGTVRIVNSAPTYKDKDKEKAAENLAACFKVHAVDPTESVYGVRYEAKARAAGAPAPQISFSGVAVEVLAEVSSEAALARDVSGVFVATKGVEAPDDVDFSLTGSSISVTVAAKDAETEQKLSIGCDSQPATGVACALYTACKGISIDGSTSLAASGLGDAVDIASSVDDAFAFGRDYETTSALSANVKGNADGTVLGHVADGFDAANAGKLAFSPASMSGVRGGASFAFDGEKNVVAHVPSESTASESGASPEAASGTPSQADGASNANAGKSASALRDPILAVAEKEAVDAVGEGVFGRKAAQEQIELQDLSSPRTAVSLVRDGKVKGSYGTVDDALSNMASGDTLRLESDIGAITFAQAGNTLVSYTIDLAGHTVGAISVSSQAVVTITSSVSGGAIGGTGAQSAALTYSGGGRLSVENVSVTNYSGATKACGVAITGTGSVAFSNVDVSVSAQGVEARGINQTSKSGGALVIKGGSIDVSTSASGVAVYGITSVAQGKTLSLEDCPLVVRGGTAAACGIDAKGVVSVKGAASQAKVSVSATEASSNMWGVRAASTASSVFLTNCAIAVSAQDVPQTAQAWCVTTGDASTQNVVAIALDGDCSFESCTNTDISLYKSPLQLGDSFNAGSGKISLLTRGLANDVFATRTKVTAQASGLAGSFEAVSGSEYDGWAAQASSSAAQKLEWHHATVAKNASTGAEYGSLAQAVAQAKSGDTVALTSNATVCGALTVQQQDLTIDLASHTLTVTAEGDASATSRLTRGALTYSGKGTLEVRGGSLSIEVGRDVETSATAASPYQGFAVSGGGVLVLSRCAATVAYTGQTTTSPQVTLYGASNASGSFRLEGASKLTVRAARAAGEFGACSVVGLYGAGSKATDAIEVDSSSSVSVENNAKPLKQGQIGYPDGVLTGTNSSSNADLIELSVDTKSDLYEEIQQQFKLYAKLDSNLDENGNVYNTGVYYASAMELPSGLIVWACSDPVSADGAGKLDSIVASHFFVRSDYQTSLDAYGISSEKAYAGVVDVRGALSATTSQGHAYGAYLPENASWSVSESLLSARATGGEYRGKLGKFDLSNYVAFAAKPQQAVVFPSDASYREIARVKPQAAKTARVGEATGEAVSGGVTYTDLFGAMNGQVNVTFSNIRSASGVSSQTVSATRGKTLAASGARMPSPSDYAVGDVTYRFVGWRMSSAGSSAYAYEPSALANDITIDANLTGVADGSVEFVACYVPVGKGQHLVKFRVEYGVYAMAAADGATPTFAACAGLAAGASPSRLTSVSSSQYTVTFKGWAADASGACEYRQGETVYGESIPAVRGDVTYSARFESALATTSLGLIYLRQMSDGTYAYSRESLKGVDWTRDAISLANERARVGQTIVQNGVTYTLLGWSPRVSDTEPLYTDTLPLVNNGDLFSEKATYYAVYKQAEKTYTVNFYVNGRLYSEAKGVTASTTLYNAWNASSNAVEPASGVEGETFKGWNADEKASTYYRASMKKVGEIAASDSGDEIDLYAIWNTAADNKTPDDGNGSGANTGNGDDGSHAADNTGSPSGKDDDSNGASGNPSGGGVALPSSGSSGTVLSSSGGSGASLASALKPADDAGGDAPDSDGDGSVAATVLDGTGAQEGAALEGADQADSEDAAGQESEDSSNAAGVVGVIVAALAAIGSLAWWFLRRRADVAEDGDDDLPAPDDDAGAPSKVAEEGIRF